MAWFRPAKESGAKDEERVGRIFRWIRARNSWDWSCALRSDAGGYRIRWADVSKHRSRRHGTIARQDDGGFEAARLEREHARDLLELRDGIRAALRDVAREAGTRGG